MSISKFVKLTIKDEKCTPDKKLFIYQGDVGVDFYLTVSFVKTVIAPIGVTLSETFDSLEHAWASLRMVTPKKEVIIRDRMDIDTDGFIKLSITEDLTNEMEDIGRYKVQIHLYDREEEEGANRITTPPFEFEVKKLIE